MINSVKKFLISILGFFAAVFAVFPLATSAASAIIYPSPSSGSFLVGSTFTISIFLNTNGSEINTVWVDIEFPPELLQVTSPTAGKSFITDWLTPPSYSNEKGVISFRGGIPGGISTSAGLISSVTFRTMASGVADIKITDSSKILLNDGAGTDILSNKVSGQYNILIPAPEGPVVVSDTHPNPDKWYSDSSPSFSWEKEDKVTGYSWSFSQNPQEAPDGISEGTDNFTSYSGIKDGIWYFHIRQQKNGIWGKTSHVQVKIDTTPPKDFTPEIGNASGLAGNQIAYFKTSDDFSGIDHYKVSLINLNNEDGLNPFFTEEISPYKISGKQAGDYKIIIRAVDKAGNIKEAESQIKIISNFLSLTNSGIRIRGSLISWGIFTLAIIILALMCGYAVYLFLKRLKKKYNDSEINLSKEINEAEKEINDVKLAEEKLRQLRMKEETALGEYQKLKEKLNEEENKNK
jgi:hypothetical protein